MDVIKINRFNKNYGQVHAVKDLNLSIEQGQIVGFVGKNGAGKSTTLRCILDMIHPTSGKIEVFGLDSVKDSKQIKSMISYIPSEAAFYDSISCNQLLRFAADFNHFPSESIEELAAYFELDLNKKINELSLGNRKKVSLIQGFLKEAQLMILDEPTSGLDPLMQNKFFDLILKEKEKGKTIFLSSHNLSEIEKYCDQVAIIKDGELVDFFNMSEVKIQHKQVVHYTTQDENVTFEINEDINEVVQKLAKLTLTSLEIKTKSVEDEFISYYKEDK
ncbi:MAG: ABC transporter ATP-binding protein [Erysipelotrichaceae bacterium]